MDVPTLLATWHRRARRAQIAHFETVARLERLKYGLGIPVVVLSTVVGSTVFASLHETTATWLKVTAGIASVVAAVLASVQTFLQHAERAERHRSAAAAYGRLKKELEQYQAFPPDEAHAKEFVTALLHRNDRLAQKSPPVPKAVWAQTERRLAQEKRRGGKSEDAV
jgi:hypothetical protein